MARRRRRRREPVWPVLVVGGVLVLGVAAGVLLTGGERADAPTRALERSAGGVVDEGAEAPPTAWDDRIRVEVLNAAGVRGLAARARDELRDQGFDVVYFGNASSFDRDTSVVLDRTARGGGAAEVAAALGIARVESAPDTGVYADVTVLLGTDWSEGGPFLSMEADTAPEAREEETPWWDVRRWWRRR